MGPRVLLATVLVLLPALSGTARADDGGAPPPAEITALEAEIQKDAALLATGSCAVACQALASMHRAVDRLCALDPGPKCSAARAKAREAERKVRESCVECGAGGEAPPPERAHERQPAPPPASAAPRGDAVPKEADKNLEAPREPSAAPPPPPPPPPPAAEAVVTRRGGCAGCVTSGDGGAPYASAIAVLFAIAAASRRRRRAR